MDASSSPARRSVKSSYSPALFGEPTAGVSISSRSRRRAQSRSGGSPTISSAYSFWRSMKARVSGLSWSSSQRYGSSNSTPWSVSVKGIRSVSGGGG